MISNQMPIYFTHGNGFPNLAYQQLFKALAPEYQTVFTEMLGHDPNFPVTNNWPKLVEQLLFNIEASSVKKPLIGLGHSFGGVLTLLASIKKPDYFHSVIMLDAPLLTPFFSYGLKFLKWIDLVDYVTPAIKAKKRRVHWRSSEEAYDYFETKPLFRYVDKTCLQDYVTYGLVPTTEGVELKFDPKIEYAIFRTLPDNLSIIKSLPVKTTLIYGNQSDVLGKKTLQYMSDRYQIFCEKITGTHMFPFEKPKETALLIKKIIT